MNIIKNWKMGVIAVIVGAVVMTTAASCGTDNGNSTAQQNKQNNIAAGTAQKFDQAVPYPYEGSAFPTDPLERKNLSQRLQMQNSAGATTYVYMMTFSGQVYGYYVARGKVSSTGSQMTSTQVMVDCGNNSASCPIDAIGDDGSYGPEEGGQFGIFFITTTGNLIETDQPFISSTQPIKIYANVPNLDAKVKK